jgi:hypothetical protein
MINQFNHSESYFHFVFSRLIENVGLLKDQNILPPSAAEM